MKNFLQPFLQLYKTTIMNEQMKNDLTLFL